MSELKLRVLFVCLGNICRSPLAEVVVKNVAQEQGLSHLFHFESAGTGDWHIGKGADHRSAATALQYGLSLAQHRAQQINRRNINDWDVFVAMDAANKQDLIHLGAPISNIVMMRDFEGADVTPDVPDPYYGGEEGFEFAYRMLNKNAIGLLQQLQQMRASSL